MSPEMLLARISISQPWLGAEEAGALAEVVASGWVAQGPRVKQFEIDFASLNEAAHAVAFSSATAAMHVALVVAGIGRGDHVVVPAPAVAALAGAIAGVGAVPVLCDVEPRFGNATEATIRAALTLDTRAVIVSDQGGMPVDLDPIKEFCARHSITVIEDAASAVGSLYKGHPVGVGADITVWAFGPEGTLTTGEGGMLTTGRTDWAIRARSLREHIPLLPRARQSSPLSPRDVTETGLNCRMTDLQAALGNVQLRKLARIVQRRRDIATSYTAGLAGLAGLRLASDPPHGNANFQSYWLEVGDGFGVDREGLLERLSDAGIEAAPAMTLGRRLSRWREAGVSALQNAELLSARTLVLPMHYQLDGVGINRVINTIQASGAGTYR